MRRIGGLALGIGGLVFAAAAVVFAATVVDAVRVEEVRTPSEPVPISESEGVLASMEEPAPSLASAIPDAPSRVQENTRGSLQGIIYPRVTNNEILEAVNQDIFQPDRTPSVERYLFPSERAEPVRSSRNNRRQSEPDLRIVGTAIGGDLALALVQPDDSIPFAVLLGEVVDGFILAAITEDAVTLIRDGAEFTLPVVEPQRGSSSNNNRNRNTRNSNADAAAAQALTERVQQMLQGMGRGQMQRGGLTLGEPIRIERVPGGGQATGTTVMIRGRPGGGGGGGQGGSCP